MMEEEFNGEEREYYSIELPIEGIRLVHKAFKIAVDKWPGGDPVEQEELIAMRDNFFRIILEHQFNNIDTDRPGDY